MSHFHRPATRLAERDEPERSDPDESQDNQRSPFADVAERFANWFTGLDRLPESLPARAGVPYGDPLQQLSAGTADDPGQGRFPVTALGYDRLAVDEHVAALERELDELRAHGQPPMTVTEELERIGEQTASILVVAHDKAHETTKRAEEQAERCIADAAANAVSITEEAQRRLRELDAETDSVWRERERLLEDVRAVSSALNALADQASDRFPAAPDQSATTAFPAGAGSPAASGGVATALAPQATEPFLPVDEAEALGEAPLAAGPVGEPGDTASWLAGFEPPEDDLERR